MKKIWNSFTSFLRTFKSMSVIRPIPKIKIGSFEDDAKALENDWKTIGNDIRSVIRQINNENKNPDKI